ncbi:MAG: PepSY domain-containing protein [Alphaproteobacteria bacterium]
MRPILSLALGLALAGGSTIALADRPGPDWMPFEQVVQKVKQAGYTSISKLEADDGRWEGEGVKDGRNMEFRADPRTGVITAEKPD